MGEERERLTENGVFQTLYAGFIQTFITSLVAERGGGGGGGGGEREREKRETERGLLERGLLIDNVGSRQRLAIEGGGGGGGWETDRQTDGETHFSVHDY